MQVKKLLFQYVAFLISNLPCASLEKATCKNDVCAILMYEEFVFMLQKKISADTFYISEPD